LKGFDRKKADVICDLQAMAELGMAGADLALKKTQEGVLDEEIERFENSADISLVVSALANSV
jgi:hypothetical protein